MSIHLLSQPFVLSDVRVQAMTKMWKEDKQGQRKMLNEGLAEWLNKHNAFCLWRQDVGSVTEGRDIGYTTVPELRVEAWSFLGGRIALIQIHRAGGWSIFTEGDSIATDATLLDAERRLGLVK